MQVGSAVMAAGRTGALLVDPPGVVAVTRAAQTKLTAARKSLGGAAAARGQHAVEYVDTAFDGARDVGGPADPHQIARPVGRQQRQRDVERAEHRRLALADSEAAHRI